MNTIRAKIYALLKQDAKISSQGGFTLVEVIIATVMMTALLSSLIKVFTRGKAVNDGQKDRRVAIDLAKERLEQIDTLSFSNVENNLLGSTLEQPPRNMSGVPINGWNGRPNYNTYQRTTFVGYLKDDPLTTAVDIIEDCGLGTETCNYLRVRVVVSSTKTVYQVGRVEDVVLETVLSRWN